MGGRQGKADKCKEGGGREGGRVLLMGHLGKGRNEET